MESVDAKMVRAKEHLDTLHAEAGVFFESTKRNFILKSNGQEAWIVHYIARCIAWNRFSFCAWLQVSPPRGKKLRRSLPPASQPGLLLPRR
jgi:hypothetical protein